MADVNDKRDSQLEEIVAYLDGELPAADCARVERRLASDQAFRRQVSRIERAWAALDELPQTRVDDKFSRTTMEMVVDFAKQDAATIPAPQKTISTPWVKRSNWSPWLAAVAAVAIGFLVCRVAWQSPNRALIQDLPVIAAADSLTAVNGISELRTIHDRLGAELASATAAATPDASSAKEFAWLATTGFDQRREIVEGLSDDDKLALRGQFNRFRELPPDEQQKLRDLEAEIARSPDADELRKTLVALRQWIASLPPQDQEELRAMSADRRLTTLAEWMGPREVASALSLTDEELRAFAHVVEEPFKAARRKLEGVMREYRGRRRGDGGGFGSGGGEPRMAAALFATRGLAADGDLLKAALAALPERTKDTFDKLEPMPKLLWVITWMRQANAVAGQVSDAELEHYFAEELSEDEQLELLGLPAGDLHAELVKRYVGEPDLGFGRPRFDGRGRGPRGRGRDDFDGRGPGPPPRRDDGFGPPEFGRGGRGPGGPPPGFGGLDDGPGFGPPPGDGPPDGFGRPRDRFDDRPHEPDDRGFEGPPRDQQ